MVVAARARRAVGAAIGAAGTKPAAIGRDRVVGAMAGRAEVYGRRGKEGRNIGGGGG